jgi:hypothetical protein
LDLFLYFFILKKLFVFWLYNRKSMGKLLGRLRIKAKENNTRDSNVVPHRSTNRARWCLTSQSGRNAGLSSWYGRSRHVKGNGCIISLQYTTCTYLVYVVIFNKTTITRYSTCTYTLTEIFIRTSTIRVQVLYISKKKRF